MVLVLFAGAGFSVEAGLPVQRDFIQFIRDREIVQDWSSKYNAISAAMILGSMLHEKSEVTLEEAFGALEYTHFTHDSDYRVAYFKATKDKDIFVSSEKGLPIGKVRSDFLNALGDVFSPWFVRNQYVPEALKRRYTLLGLYNNVDLYERFFVELVRKADLRVITTNYDLVCESGLKTISGFKLEHFPFKQKLDETTVPILKLHGSIDWRETPIDSPNIIPPTWMKWYYQSDKYRLIWREAERYINESDTMLFIGYSMPEIDMAVRYLIRSGLQSTSRGTKPKTIFVLTKDAQVEKRYRELEKQDTVSRLEIIPMYFREFVESGKMEEILELI